MPTVANANGTVGGVTSGNRLMLESVSRDYSLDVAMLHGMAFSLDDNAVTPTGPADVFARLANTTEGKIMVITHLRATCAAADSISVQLVPNYTSAGTHGAKEPLNLNAGSGNLASSYGIFESDVNITGDTGAVTTHQVCDLQLTTADTDYSTDFKPPLVVPNGYSCILEAETGTQAIQYSITFYFADSGYQND